MAGTVNLGMAATADPHANRPAMQGGQPMAAAVANGGATLLPQQQQQQQQPAAALAPASVSTATAIAALQPRTGYGFTPQQLVVLKHQILAFRNLKSGKEVAADTLAVVNGAVPPAQQLQQAPTPVPAQPLPPPRPMPVPQPQPRPAAVQLTPQQQAQAQALRAQQQAAALAAAQRSRLLEREPPLHRPLTAPLFGTMPAARAAQLPAGGRTLAQPLGLNFDAAGLMAAEYQRVMQRARDLRQVELEEELAAIKHDPKGATRRMQLQIELRGLRLIEVQAAMRTKVEAKQEEILRMNDRTYRKFLRFNLRQRGDMLKAEEKARAQRGAERAAAVKAFRSEMSDRSSAAQEARRAAVRGVEKAHARLGREANKAADDMRTRRMEALKAHDFEAYQDLLRSEPGAAGAGTGAGAEERYEAVSKFLADTEEYIHKLAGKVASVKLGQEASEAAAAAVLEARATGASEEEVKAAAAAAAAEAAAKSELMSRSRHHVGDAQSRYYSLAHSVGESIQEAPRTLQPPPGAALREYQMVGLQWMVSLYNNHLNGILADEMGLGKTVQVMALIAHLMEKKGNYGPHLIIVPNAVMVNWKAELTRWLPGVRCIYYVGTREVRARMFNTEVSALQFNVLVTTYEYIMRDRARLSKVEWKYIIIDEAQRMKDRQSKLAKDLDRFTTARRLLLTGTPLQNDLRELWSLLNLLLPAVFDDKGMFDDWFGDAFGADGDKKAGAGGEEWLQTEKRVVVIHRLHQILEPFMLRRQVQDVESRLPEKVAVVVKCAMTPYQSVIYNWVKMTGTLRTDPTQPLPGRTRRPFLPLNNKCMELRKLCNHPMLSYPAVPGATLDAATIAAECGKLVLLDRILVKLHSAGHRVLLFSTMTRLLDLLQAYLASRVLPNGDSMKALRIDGSTSLEDRETAIQQFNAPDSKAFIFLLSIRAAGRGLNLQSADTVIIYDPDPNPKNEEQAIARSHRIGQTREVRVIHLEAVADADAFAVVDEAAGHPRAPPKATPEGQPLYADSIESLVRNKIQAMKIDMANEVIDAGRFDMQTSMAERRETLEQMLQDEDRLKQAVNTTPDHAALNAMLARGPEEVALFQSLDAQPGLWLSAPAPAEAVPHFLRYEADDVREAITATSKLRPDQVTELAALAGEPGLFGPPPPGGAPVRHRAPLLPPAQQLGKRQTKRPASYAEAADLDSYLDGSGGESDGDEDATAAAADDADMEEEVVDANLLLEGSASQQGEDSQQQRRSVPNSASSSPTHLGPSAAGVQRTPSLGNLGRQQQQQHPPPPGYHDARMTGVGAEHQHLNPGVAAKRPSLSNATTNGQPAAKKAKQNGPLKVKFGGAH